MYVSLTLQQFSIAFSFTAIRAKQPSTTLFRYTNGVFPIDCTDQGQEDKSIRHKITSVSCQGTIGEQV